MWGDTVEHTARTSVYPAAYSDREGFALGSMFTAVTEAPR